MRKCFALFWGLVVAFWRQFRLITRGGGSQSQVLPTTHGFGPLQPPSPYVKPTPALSFAAAATSASFSIVIAGNSAASAPPSVAADFHGPPQGNTEDGGGDWESWSKSAEVDLASQLPDRETRAAMKVDSLFAEMTPEYVQPRKARKREVGADQHVSRLGVDETFVGSSAAPTADNPSLASALGDWSEDGASNAADGDAWDADNVNVSEVMRDKRRQERLERKRHHEAKMQQAKRDQHQAQALAAKRLPDKTK